MSLRCMQCGHELVLEEENRRISALEKQLAELKGELLKYISMTDGMTKHISAVEAKLATAMTALEKVMEVSGTSTLHYHTARSALASTGEKSGL